MAAVVGCGGGNGGGVDGAAGGPEWAGRWVGSLGPLFAPMKSVNPPCKFDRPCHNKVEVDPESARGALRVLRSGLRTERRRAPKAPSRPTISTGRRSRKRSNELGCNRSQETAWFCRPHPGGAPRNQPQGRRIGPPQGLGSRMGFGRSQGRRTKRRTLQQGEADGRTSASRITAIRSSVEAVGRGRVFSAPSRERPPAAAAWPNPTGLTRQRGPAI